ncbi:hypothetical protein AVEN_93992-1 [Araneus ventricosus]|uniref:Uncharacterized protein n=1 Tax=Araneus ventricosus TaxID=182803 RepID=A0A4Y2CMR7_ARAVE|nr:hypothetical protein AVEN_93992-1 [Araneus ventricosus]
MITLPYGLIEGASTLRSREHATKVTMDKRTRQKIPAQRKSLNRPPSLRLIKKHTLDVQPKFNAFIFHSSPSLPGGVYPRFSQWRRGCMLAQYDGEEDNVNWLKKEVLRERKAAQSSRSFFFTSSALGKYSW